MSLRFLKGLKEHLFPPIEDTDRFTDPPEAIANAIGDIEYAEARDLMHDAERSYDEPNRRSEAAERRATAILGSAGIAAGLTTAGAGLLLDPTKIAGSWRSGIAVILGLAIFSLFMAALRAVMSLRVLTWHVPDMQALLPSGQADVLPKTVLRAATLLYKGSRNEGNARWKVALAGAATWWFTRAVLFLLLTVVLLLVFIIFAQQNVSPS